MPIPWNQFDKGISEIEYGILNLPKSNHNKAFTADEIKENLGYKLEARDPITFIKELYKSIGLEIILRNMTKRGLLVKHRISRVIYYAYQEE